MSYELAIDNHASKVGRFWGNAFGWELRTENGDQGAGNRVTERSTNGSSASEWHPVSLSTDGATCDTVRYVLQPMVLVEYFARYSLGVAATFEEMRHSNKAATIVPHNCVLFVGVRNGICVLEHLKALSTSLGKEVFLATVVWYVSTGFTDAAKWADLKPANLTQRGLVEVFKGSVVYRESPAPVFHL